MRYFARVGVAALLAMLAVPNSWSMITSGGGSPVQGLNWPAGAESLANLPTRFSYWEGPPFGGGNSHFNYQGKSTADFQAALDAFAKIEAPRLEMKIMDGLTTSSPAGGGKLIHWEFEVWDSERFASLNTPGEKISFLSSNPLYGRPLPAPLLTLFLAPENPVKWEEVQVPQNVTVIDCRVATSPYSDSKGGVLRVLLRDMATSAAIAGATVEAGHYKNRVFEPKHVARTGADGVALIRDIPAGTFVVRAQHDGYAPRMLGNHKNFGRTLIALDDAKLAPRAALEGSVVDATGRPIPGATVGVRGLIAMDNTGYEMSLFNEGLITETDELGRFKFDLLPAGRVNLAVSKASFDYFSFQTHPIPGDEVKLTMGVSGMIRGSLIGMEKAKIPEGYKFYVSLDPVGEPLGRWSGDKPVGEDGSFAFEGVPADQYRLTPFVAKPQRGGYSRGDKDPQFEAKEVTLKEGEPLSMVFDVGGK